MSLTRRWRQLPPCLIFDGRTIYGRRHSAAEVDPATRRGACVIRCRIRALLLSRFASTFRSQQIRVRNAERRIPVRQRCYSREIELHRFAVCPGWHSLGSYRVLASGGSHDCWSCVPSSPPMPTEAWAATCCAVTDRRSPFRISFRRWNRRCCARCHPHLHSVWCSVVFIGAVVLTVVYGLPHNGKDRIDVDWLRETPTVVYPASDVGSWLSSADMESASPRRRAEWEGSRLAMMVDETHRKSGGRSWVDGVAAQAGIAKLWRWDFLARVAFSSNTVRSRSVA